MSADFMDTVRQTVAEVFALDPSTVGSDSSPETIPAWDSLGHLNLILALEQQFDISFDPDQIPQLTSVQALADAVASLKN